MKKASVFIIIVLEIALTACANGGGEKIFDTTIDTGNERVFAVSIKPGDEYLHDFPLFLFFKLKNPPQIAVWVETPEGKYLETLFVTRKSGTQGWLKAADDPLDKNSIRRPESLPVWSWSRNITAADGIPMPTKDQPLTDEVSHASPRKDFSLVATSAEGHRTVVIYLEVNHSTDFNAKYSADLEPGDPEYNGGKYGSGQPSIVYRAVVNPDELDESGIFFELAGHGSPSGKDGKIYGDLSGIDSALKIIKSVRVYLKVNNNE